MSFEDQKTALEGYIPKHDKVSWKRKQKNIDKIMTEIVDPLEEKIMGLMVVKNEAIDRITKIRDQMILECIHPSDHLIPGEDDTIFCKFCNKQIGVIVRHDSEEKGKS